MDWTAVFLLGGKGRNGSTEECCALQSGGAAGKEREDDKRNQRRRGNESNDLLKTRGNRERERDVRRQDAWRSFVFTLSVLSVSASSSSLVFISDTAGNPSMTHLAVECCEPGSAGGGSGVRNRRQILLNHSRHRRSPSGMRGCGWEIRE